MAGKKRYATSLPRGDFKLAALPPAPARLEFEDRCEKALPTIATKFALAHLLPELSQAMVAAFEEYNLWHAYYGGLKMGAGDKRELRPLISGLKTALTALEKAQVRNRLHLAASCMPETSRPSGPNDGVHFLFGASVYDSPQRAAASIRGLLAVAEHPHDGRRLSHLPRGDIRAAAVPLHGFWVQTAGRPKGVHQTDGKYREVVDFLRDTLALIDPDATRRMLVDFKL